MIKKIIWFVLIAVIAVALIRVFPWNDPGQAWTALGDASDKFGAWVGKVVDSTHANDVKPPENGLMPTTNADIPTDIKP